MKIDRTLSLVCSPLEGLLYAPSSKVFKLITTLSRQEEFANNIYSCREFLKLKELYSTGATKRKEEFDKQLKSLSPEIHSKYIMMLNQIIKDFNLPYQFISTLNYLVGTALIFEPASPIMPLNFTQKTIVAPGVYIQIFENMTISDLIEQIRLNRNAIEKGMESLPKIKKPIKHKDGLDIGGFINIMKNHHKMTYKEIADYLEMLEEDDYKLYGAVKPIELSEKEVAIYHLRYKKDHKYSSIPTKK